MSLRDKIVLSLCLVHSGLKMRWTIKQRTFTADYLHLNPEVVRRRLVKAVEHCEEISSDSEVDKPKEDKVLLHVAVLSRNPTRSWLLENRPDLQMEGKAWVHNHACPRGHPNMKARDFHQFLNEQLLPKPSYLQTNIVSEDTARRWLLKLGFRTMKTTRECTLMGMKEET